MNNFKIKSKKKGGNLTHLDNSLAFSAATKLEDYYVQGGTLVSAIWAVCGWSIAKATKTKGRLYTTIVGHRSDFHDNPFGSEEGKYGTQYKLR